MKKLFPLLGVTLVLQAGISCSAFAIQRKHKPWMMFGHSHANPKVEQDPQPVTASNPKDAGSRVASRAMDYEGTRYKFGSASKRAVDCSGLVTRVWEDLKMKKIPRASSALYQSGKPVHLAELRPGDLVFFKNTYKHGISHVGVYTGNNKFVHAAGHSKGVTITKLSDPYYQLHYAGARRLY